jgi:copper chaperone
MTQTISVGGMTCANCARHVTEALQALPSVTRVEVDFVSGTARFDAERHIPRPELRAALDEAGYDLIG